MKTLFRKVAVGILLLIGVASPAWAVDIAITAASVVPTASTIIQHGVAGVAVTAGQAVYLDANNLLQLSKANAIGTAGIYGIALNNAAAGQTLSVATGGHITTNAVLTKGVAVYVSQANGGGLCLVADITSGNYPIIAGIATSTTDLLLKFVDPDVTL